VDGEEGSRGYIWLGVTALTDYTTSIDAFPTPLGEQGNGCYDRAFVFDC